MDNNRYVLLLGEIMCQVSPLILLKTYIPPKKGGGVPSLRFRPLGIIYFKCPSSVIFWGPWIMKILGSRVSPRILFSCFKKNGHFSGSTLFGFTRALYSSPPFLWQMSTWKWAQIMKHRRICCWGEIDLEQRQHWTVSCQGDGRF